MKKLPNSWKYIDEIILNILSVDLFFDSSNYKIVLNCNFENIVKGRCVVKIEKKKKNEKDQILIFSDRPLMELKIFYDKTFFYEVLDWLDKKANRKKKIAIKISEGLAINKEGYLYVREKTKVEVLNVEWSIPIN